MSPLIVFNTSEPLSLNVDIQSISGGFENIDKTIKVGDKVRKVL